MKARVLVLLVGFLAIFLSEFVVGESVIGVSPGTVNFRDVLRGGYAERFLTLSTPDIEDEIFVSATPRGEIASWLNYSENFTISRDNPGRMFLSVKPPSDIPNGNYTGFLRISTGALADLPPGQAVNAIRAVLDVAIIVEITDVEVMSCTAQYFDVQSAEKGDDVIFDIEIYNQGNVRLNPLVVLEIWDQEQVELVKTVEFRPEDILPTKEQSFQYRMSTDDMEIGQYWVNVRVPDCFSESLLTFDVLEPGALKAEGILLRIFSVPWSEVGETFPIVAEFKNIGEKEVGAKFKGQISLDGEIQRLLESERVGVPISTMENFTFFFTPTEPGSYVVSGRVFYENKRTFESSAVFNVKPRSFNFRNVVMTIIYMVLMLVIAFLLYKVHNERKRYLGKVRGLKYA